MSPAQSRMAARVLVSPPGWRIVAQLVCTGGSLSDLDIFSFGADAERLRRRIHGKITGKEARPGDARGGCHAIEMERHGSVRDSEARRTTHDIFAVWAGDRPRLRSRDSKASKAESSSLMSEHGDSWWSVSICTGGQSSRTS